MCDSITLLETIGADASLMSAEGAALHELLASAGLEPALRTALLDGDVGTLRALLRAPEIVCCIVDPAEEDDEEEEEEEGEEDDEGEIAPTPQPKPRGSSL